jgi:type IV pilus assembly protein PilO
VKLKEGGKLKPEALLAVVVGGVVVAGLLGWFVLVRPQGAKVKHLQAQQHEVQQQLDARRQRTADARGAPTVRVADVYRLAKAMPDKVDMPDLVLELSQLARDSGIGFDSITPATAASLTGYQVVPITVTFNGNFFNLSDFLYRLRTLVDVHNAQLDATGRLFSVDTISFTEGSSGFPSIKASLVIDAFIYGSAAPAAGSSGTGTTATTTTTSTETSSTTTTTSPSGAGTSASAAGAP